MRLRGWCASQTFFVGAPNWPSMSNGEYGCNAETVDPGVYYLRVVKTGTDLNSDFNRFFTGLNGVTTVTNSTDCPTAATPLLPSCSAT